ncbi:ATP-binding protein [Aquabacterium sp.]|uniref:ATP-binding protein n=1 Tax=Aquabacterium sp. TaxID=1872578 RepID=UPI0035B395EF
MSETTFFAPAERASPDALLAQLRAITTSPVTDGILRTVDGLLAIVNEQRQVVSVNEQLLKSLGVEDAATLLSLRMGEVMGCVHACEPPAGCGTTRHCASCGQAIATVTALSSNAVVERKCVMQVNREGARADLCLSVRACPFEIGGERFLALLLRDITEEQRLAASERVILHDLGNVLNGLRLAVPEGLNAADADKARQRVAALNRMIEGVSRTLKLHRAIVDGRIDHYSPASEDIFFDQLFGDVQALIEKHPAAANKQLEVGSMPHAAIRTDTTAVSRVLLNMLINALEATDTLGHVRVEARDEGKDIVFSVWNARAIPPTLALRVFQRNFSTHHEPGRGLGTSSMKMLGEDLLGGHVSFISNEADGTTFVFTLPKAPPATH